MQRYRSLGELVGRCPYDEGDSPPNLLDVNTIDIAQPEGARLYAKGENILAPYRNRPLGALACNDDFIRWILEHPLIVPVSVTAPPGHPYVGLTEVDLSDEVVNGIPINTGYVDSADEWAGHRDMYIGPSAAALRYFQVTDVDGLPLKDVGGNIIDVTDVKITPGGVSIWDGNPNKPITPALADIDSLTRYSVTCSAQVPTFAACGAQPGHICRISTSTGGVNDGSYVIRHVSGNTLTLGPKEQFDANDTTFEDAVLDVTLANPGRVQVYGRRYGAPLGLFALSATAPTRPTLTFSAVLPVASFKIHFGLLQSPRGLTHVLRYVLDRFRLSTEAYATGAVAPHAASHQHDGGDEVATVTPDVNAIPKATASGQLDPGWIPPLWGVGLVGTIGDGNPVTSMELHYRSALRATAPTATQIGAGIARARSFRVPSAITVNRIRCYAVAKPIAAYYMLAIYDNTTGLPIWSIADIGEVMDVGWWSLALGGITLTSDRYYWICYGAKAVYATRPFDSPAHDALAAWGSLATAPPPGNLLALGLRLYGHFALTGPAPYTWPVALPAMGDAAWATNATGTIPAFLLDADATP